jgi:hypothetical protein
VYSSLRLKLLGVGGQGHASGTTPARKEPSIICPYELKIKAIRILLGLKPGIYRRGCYSYIEMLVVCDVLFRPTNGR